MLKQKFDIQGMTCSSCSSHVEKAVSKLEGVKTIQVNLLQNNMLVEYEENKLSKEQIIQAVVEAGYGASIEKEEQDKHTKQAKTIDNRDTIKSMKKRLILSIIFLIPLMYIAMYHMFYEWFGMPIPKIIYTSFHGNENAICFGLTQFLLVLPIVYINRNYFIVGYKRLLKRSPNMDSLIAVGSSAAIFYGIFAMYRIGFRIRT